MRSTHVTSHNSVALCARHILIPLCLSLSGVSAEEVGGTGETARSGERIRQQIDSFLQTAPVIKGANDTYGKSHVYVGFAISSVNVSIADVRWSKFRNVAYTEALSQARAQCVQSLGLSIQDETIRSLEQNLGIDPMDANKPAEGAGRIDRIVEKLGAVVEGSIDKSLVEIGVDPNEFKSAPKQTRVEKLKSGLIQSTIKRAFGSTVGLMPVMTFEGEGGDGTYSVGVVVLRTPGTVEFAKSIVDSRVPLPITQAPPNKSLRDRIKSSSLPLQHGIRETVDDEGRPALVAFGQWANSSSSTNPIIVAKYEEIAIDKARINADREIAQFLTSQTNAEESASIDSLLQDFDDIGSDGFVSSDDFAKLLDKSVKRSNTRATVHITGIEDLYTWSEKHPITGARLIGVIRVWTPTTEQSANNLKAQLDAHSGQRKASSGAPGESTVPGAKPIGPVLGGQSQL